MKPGYKRTEVGVIPEDWEVKHLHEISSVTSGGTPSRANMNYWNGNIPWITTSEVDFCNINSANQFITKEGLDNSAAKLFPCNTLLMALYGQGKTRGKVGILGMEATTNQACAAILLTSGISSKFVFYSLANKYEEIRNLSNTGNQENLNNSLVRSISILLPPESEQRAIAAVLSDVDALLNTLDRLIAKKRGIKQAAMQELLSGETRLPGFQGEWEVKRLGEIGYFLKSCGVSKSEAQSGHIPCVRYGEIYTHHNDYIKSFNSRISEAVAATATKIINGDLLFAGSGETKKEIGKCIAFIDHCEAYAGGDIVILRPNGVNPVFMGYYCNTTQINTQKSSRGQGDAIVHISSSALAAIEVKLPALAEQTAIAAILSDMDAELVALEARRDKTLGIKQAMMQELLTGKTRLKIPESNIVAVDFSPEQKHADTQVSTGKPHNWAINEAVVLSVLVKRFGSEEFPLGRMRRTKLAYLMHRHIEHVAEGYLKKAAGPYNPDVKYRGPESIAQQNGYVRRHKHGNYSGFIAADNIAEAEDYFAKWYGTEVLDWLEQFHRKPNDELELLATVDMAAEDLKRQGASVKLESIKSIIRNYPEWEAKLDRNIFSDFNITRAIKRVGELFAE